MDELRQRRLQVARDHMRLETLHDWDGVLATFEHPHYDINDGAAVFDGEEAVRRGDRVMEPTGRKFRIRMMASFEFKPGSGRIVCKRPHIDPGHHRPRARA